MGLAGHDDVLVFSLFQNRRGDIVAAGGQAVRPVLPLLPVPEINDDVQAEVVQKVPVRLVLRCDGRRAEQFKAANALAVRADQSAHIPEIAKCTKFTHIRPLSIVVRTFLFIYICDLCVFRNKIFVRKY